MSVDNFLHSALSTPFTPAPTLSHLPAQGTMSADNFLRGGILGCDTLILGTPKDLGYPDSDALALAGEGG